MKTQITQVTQDDFKRILVRAVVLPIILIGIFAGTLLWQVNNLLSTVQWVDHTDQVIAQAHEIQTLLVDRETGMRGYIITGNPIFLEPYNLAASQLPTTFSEFGRLVSDNPLEVKRLDELRVRYSEWDALVSSSISLKAKNGDAAAAQVEGKNRMDAMRAQIDEIIKTEEELRGMRSKTALRTAQLTISISIILTVLLAGIIAFFIRHQLMTLSRNYASALMAAEAFAAEIIEQSQQVKESLLEARAAKERAERRVAELERNTGHKS
jgi:CHASE3 domain sensor protein